MGRKVANYTHTITVRYGSKFQEEHGEKLIEVFINAWKDHMENNHKGNKIKHVVKPLNFETIYADVVGSFNKAKEEHEK